MKKRNTFIICLFLLFILFTTGCIRTPPPNQYNSDQTWINKINNTFYYNESKLDEKLSTTIYCPTGLYVRYGTLTAGNVSSLCLKEEGYQINVSEAAGANAMETYYNFSNVTSFNGLKMFEQYVDGAGHYQVVEIYDYVSLTWEGGYYTMYDQPTFEQIDISIDDGTDHIANGTVQVRIRHVSNGVGTHRLYVDQLILTQGLSITTTLTETDPIWVAARTNYYNKTETDSLHNQATNTTSNVVFNTANITSNSTIVNLSITTTGINTTLKIPVGGCLIVTDDSNPFAWLCQDDVVRATTFNGSGAQLTTLNGAAISSGQVPVARGGTGSSTTTGSGGNVLQTGATMRNLTIGSGGSDWIRLNNSNYVACTAAAEGIIVYNNTAKKHYGCNSTAWNALY